MIDYFFTLLSNFCFSNTVPYFCASNFLSQVLYHILNNHTIWCNLLFIHSSLVFSLNSGPDLGVGTAEAKHNGVCRGGRWLWPRGLWIHRRLHLWAVGRHYRRQGRQAQEVMSVAGVHIPTTMRNLYWMSSLQVVFF